MLSSFYRVHQLAGGVPYLGSKTLIVSFEGRRINASMHDGNSKERKREKKTLDEKI